MARLHRPGFILLPQSGPKRVDSDRGPLSKVEPGSGVAAPGCDEQTAEARRDGLGGH